MTASPASAVSRGGRLYYGWIVAAVTAFSLLVSSGVRSMPGVFVVPLEVDLGWSRPEISFAVSVGLLLYGLAGPFAGRLMDRFGPRRVMLVGILVFGTATAASAAMSTLWQLNLLWGVASGIGTGVAAAVLGATVANRWFVQRRGLVLGAFGAATSAGQLVFVPLLMWLVVVAGWRSSALLLGAIALAVLVPVFLFMRDEPADVGERPYGAAPLPAAETPGNGAQPLRVGDAAAAPASSGGVMSRALRTPEFWLLSGSFFVCGATSNGLIGTHLIPHSIDHGIPEVTAASALALMGAFNFVGTLGSGWLTDRFDPRKLLAVYYTLRGFSLFVLPFATDFSGLAIFAVVFGLDYIATVPPTSALAADLFGRRNVGTVFGWIFFAHQAGAALAAYLGGVAREVA
ncbi:MAG TPA: MFS transporter, partial [Chloroflexota bacterium]|nr:MFS transporter [Chloroflexota bacterium]